VPSKRSRTALSSGTLSVSPVTDDHGVAAQVAVGDTVEVVAAQVRQQHRVARRSRTDALTALLVSAVLAVGTLL